jgi:hypothetical protein
MKRTTVSIAVATVVLTGLGVYGFSTAWAVPASLSGPGNSVTVAAGQLPIELGNTGSGDTAGMDAMMRPYLERLPANAQDELRRMHERMQTEMSGSGGAAVPNSMTNSMMSGGGMTNAGTPVGASG